MALADLISLWRGETLDDPRPNKALDPEWLSILLHQYDLRDHVLDAARFGVQHSFSSPRPPDRSPAANHASARRYALALERSLAEGQDSGTYIAVFTRVALRWTSLRYSPFGCVPKKAVDPEFEARLIHDLSYPWPWSVNTRSSQEQLPTLAFESIRRLAQRIEVLSRLFPGRTIRIMKGDVKSAFRNIPVSASLAAHFAGSYGDHITVVDLCLPFGWTGSPAHYCAFGGAISYLVARESPRSLDPLDADEEPFFSFVWVDDHILIEVDRGRRLELAELALRLSMTAVLGPDATNDKKFSSWETRLTALGLVWDTTRRTVSMPQDKLDKAVGRITAIVDGNRASKHELAQLLGSLRHVSICVRAARAFLQRLHSFWVGVPSFGRYPLPSDVQRDLLWVRALLTAGRLNQVPTSIVAGTLDPAVHLFMDASDQGLCVLYPAEREFVRVQFDAAERAALRHPTAPFSINVREALSVAFATLIWGPRWATRDENQPVHIRCWLDNAAAVSWYDRRHSQNPLGQELNRVVSCCETAYNLHVSTAHLPGSFNTLADLGSRAWIPPATQKWTELTSSWSEQAIPSCYRRIYDADSWNSSGSHSPHPPASSTSRHGSSGAGSAVNVGGPGGSVLTTHSSDPYNLLLSRLAHGRMADRPLFDIKPYGISSATSDGIISSPQDTDHNLLPNTSSLLPVTDIAGAPTINYTKAVCTRVTLRGSKTDQVGASTTRELRKSQTAPVCPVFAACLLLHSARTLSLDPTHPVCSFSVGTVVSSDLMTKVLRWAASACGVDARHISTHSLRIGGASSLHAAGVSADIIRMHGRWASEAYQRYLRHTDAAQLALAERMGSTTSKPHDAPTITSHGAARAPALSRSVHRESQ